MVSSTDRLRNIIRYCLAVFLLLASLLLLVLVLLLLLSQNVFSYFIIVVWTGPLGLLGALISAHHHLLKGASECEQEHTNDSVAPRARDTQNRATLRSL